VAKGCSALHRGFSRFSDQLVAHLRAEKDALGRAGAPWDRRHAA
jgi:hypothetical protein